MPFYLSSQGLWHRQGAAQGDEGNGDVGPRQRARLVDRLPLFKWGSPRSAPQSTFKEKLPVAYLC